MKNKGENTMKNTTTMKITNTRNVTVQILPSYTPKNVMKHQIKSHFKNRYFGNGGTRPQCRISSVYNKAFSSYKTNQVINHITKFRKLEKEVA
jgi:predicted oxidoreductase